MTKSLSNMIGVSYRNFLKPILFKFDPEFVHDRFLSSGKFLGKFSITRSTTKKLLRYENKRYLSQKISGIAFNNPVGLSAGFDKNVDLMEIMPAVGFGFMQVGSVTLNSYEGNPKPRLKRLPKSKGLVVYYGLKNIGVDKIIPKLEKFRKKNINNKDSDFRLSVSIAKTNSKTAASCEDGIADYIATLKKIEQYNKTNKLQLNDLFTINISCPNTFGGEPYTTPERLDLLLKAVTEVNATKPIFIKMPIDLSWTDFSRLLDVIVKYNIDGVIISNLTKNRAANTIKDEIPTEIKGGISGMPTQKLSLDLISKTYKNYGNKLIIVGVGGIFSASDAYKKIKAGASLVQLITGMIYQGPQLIGEINRELVDLLKKDGYSNITEAIGADHRKNN